MFDGRDREQCPACGIVAYRNPTPVTLTVVEHENKLLLIRRAVSPLKGYWAPPGGYVECGESVTDAARREVREETELDIAIDGLIGVYSRSDIDVVIHRLPGPFRRRMRLRARLMMPRKSHCSTKVNYRSVSRRNRARALTSGSTKSFTKLPPPGGNEITQEMQS